MRVLLFAAVAVFGAVLEGAAFAAGAPPLADGETPTCDFFQAQLIGVFCGRTTYVAPSGQGGDETINVTKTVAPAHGFHGAGGGTTVQHWDYRDAYESMTLAVSPWQGVRFHATGEAFQYDNTYWSQFTPAGGGFHGPGVTTAHESGSYGGWQAVGAEATLWDRQTATGRYVLDIAGGMQFFPGGGVYRGRDLQQIGWESGAEWRLGASGLALDYYSTTFLQRFDNPGEVAAESTSRLLLASGVYGIAVGPRLEGTTVLWHAAGDNTGWSEARLGGEALLEPFRRTAFPVLRDMTLDLTALHSIGQAGLVPDWAGSASNYIYAATARFNFRF
jgi:hypothetical protein